MVSGLDSFSNCHTVWFNCIDACVLPASFLERSLVVFCWNLGRHTKDTTTTNHHNPHTKPQASKTTLLHKGFALNLFFAYITKTTETFTNHGFQTKRDARYYYYQ